MGDSDFVTVCSVDAVPEGGGATFAVGERLVALFRQANAYYAIDDVCPHMGASLGAGCLDEDLTVACPWHAWRFRVSDGTWCDNPRLKIDAYDVRVHNGQIQVRLKPKGA